MPSKNSKTAPAVKPNQPARLTDEATQAIREYQNWMLKNHHVLISINGAMNALIAFGWTTIKEAELASAQERKAAQQ